MQDWAAKLLDVQETDLKIAKIREQLDQIPAKRKEAETLYADEMNALEAARQKLKGLEVAYRQLENESAAVMEKKRNFLAKTSLIKNNDEYRAALIQIEMCDKAVDDIETRQLELMDDVEQARKDADSCRRTVELAKKRAETVKEDLHSLEQQAMARLEALQAERNTRAAAVDPSLLAQYEHLRKGRTTKPTSPCFVPVIDSVCGRCRMIVTAQFCQDVKKGKLVTCQTCGAMLYAE